MRRARAADRLRARRRRALNAVPTVIELPRASARGRYLAFAVPLGAPAAPAVPPALAVPPAFAVPPALAVPPAAPPAAAVAPPAHPNLSAASSYEQPPLHVLAVTNLFDLHEKRAFLSIEQASSPFVSQGSFSCASESSHANSTFFSCGSSMMRQDFGPRHELSAVITLLSQR